MKREGTGGIPKVICEQVVQHRAGCWCNGKEERERHGVMLDTPAFLESSLLNEGYPHCAISASVIPSLLSFFPSLSVSCRACTESQAIGRDGQRETDR
jgi:hypothetical protein